MSSLKKRFEGKNGRRTLIQALCEQALIQGNENLAEEFAKRGELVQFLHGEILIEQGQWDTDLYFILAGAFGVRVNGQRKAIRTAAESVGELAVLNGARPRTATLTAMKESLVLRFPKQTFTRLQTTTENSGELRPRS
jgi:CRP-like cAMP-binding protein